MPLLVKTINQFDKRGKCAGAHDPPLQKDPIRKMDPQVLPLLFISSSSQVQLGVQLGVQPDHFQVGALPQK